MMTLESLIETTTVAEKVTRYLRDQIIHGDLAPGDRVVQEVVANKLGISRIPIREAIHALVSEGLLDMQPRHGAIVTPISANEAREVFGLRALLEPRLLRQAGPHFTAKDADLARSALSRMEQSKQWPDDFTAWAASHWAFHIALYNPSAQSLTLGIVRRLMQHSERFMALEISTQSFSDADYKEHKQILEYCEDGEFSKAADALEAHILITPTVIDEIA